MRATKRVAVSRLQTAGFGALALVSALSMAQLVLPQTVPAGSVGASAATGFRGQLAAKDSKAAGATKSIGERPVADHDEPSETAGAALCPVVYPNDPAPSARGYRYTFLGNAFFINEQGYLLTVAHVLETFGAGGQPYVLVNRLNAPPQLIKVSVVAKDLQHDVAILRAAPNPFGGRYGVALLSLASEPAVRGEAVLAISLHPKTVQDAHSFEFQGEESSPGTVLAIESTQLQKPGPPAEVFLLSHPVVKGQSGAPVLDRTSHAAVGLIEGLWLRGAFLSTGKAAQLPTDAPGAAVPIHYAIALLDQNRIPWTPAGAPSATGPSAP